MIKSPINSRNVRFLLKIETTAIATKTQITMTLIKILLSTVKIYALNARKLINGSQLIILKLFLLRLNVKN